MATTVTPDPVRLTLVPQIGVALSALPGLVIWFWMICVSGGRRAMSRPFCANRLGGGSGEGSSRRRITEAELTSPSPGAVGIDLFWLPLGAGGHFVRFNGRVYEFLCSHHEHRPSLDLYHTALEVSVPEGRYVVENGWPIPDADPGARGVTVEGPVWVPILGRFRAFRYEVRRWRGGAIPDVDEAVASPQRITNDEAKARSVLALAERVPAYVWGRDGLHTGEMWNSNSVISWVLTKAGINARDLRPPEGGRAPGWLTGVLAAEGTPSQT